MVYKILGHHVAELGSTAHPEEQRKMGVCVSSRRRISMGKPLILADL